MDILKSNLLNQKGQALLIVVLVMVVALTVTLSLVSRSVVDLKTSTDQADSQRALAAAEAGAEQVIKTNTPIGIGSNKSLDTTSYKADINQVDGRVPFLVNGGTLIAKDEGAYIWLSTPTYNAANSFSDFWPTDGSTGTLTIYWGENADGCKDAALEIVAISGLTSAPVLSKSAVDPCSTRATLNHFTLVSVSPSTNVGGKSFYYKTSISITKGLLVNVNPIYYSSYIGASGGSVALPFQGSIITSSGTSGGSSSVSRKITVFQGYPQLPAELFPYSILSP